MARASEKFVCNACGSVYAKWAGKCEGCGGWNTIEEDPGLGAKAGESAPKGSLAASAAKGRKIDLVPLEGAGEAPPSRMICGLGEFDRVTGGGLVPGSAVLVGGDPGVGKSTILLQVCAGLAASGLPVAYISGEEAVAQVRMRASRLGLGNAPVELAAATNVRDILTTFDKTAPALVVIDSIQTMWSDVLDSAPGTVSQVRACAQDLVRFAKRANCALIIVGHVTKDGQIAGPRVVEHMVDTVLYFEGERGHQFRILRAVKNRFGATDEIGVFEMTSEGLRQVPNPSALFIGERDEGTSGSAVFAGVEGTRPVLVEFQALVAESPLGTPRRTVVGWDTGRLAMVVAVLDTRCGLRVAANDIYLNVAGGLKIMEPASDLAVAAALISSSSGIALPADAVYFGEVSLSGAVRPVAQMDARLREAEKLGFRSAVGPFPPDRTEKKRGISKSFKTISVSSLQDVVDWIQSHGAEAQAPVARLG